MRPHLAGRPGIETERERGPHLLDGTLRDHAVEARIDRRVKRLALGRDDYLRTASGSSNGAASAPCHSASEIEVAAITSSARKIRWGSLGRSLAAMTGSRA